MDVSDAFGTSSLDLLGNVVQVPCNHNICLTKMTTKTTMERQRVDTCWVVGYSFDEVASAPLAEVVLVLDDD